MAISHVAFFTPGHLKHGKFVTDLDPLLQGTAPSIRQRRAMRRQPCLYYSVRSNAVGSLAVSWAAAVGRGV